MHVQELKRQYDLKRLPSDRFEAANIADKSNNYRHAILNEVNFINILLMHMKIIMIFIFIR